MKITYGERWIRWQKRFVSELSELEASERHKARKLYSALFSINDVRCCFLESNLKYIGVGFLDHLERECAAYQFNELEPSRLFLGAAVYREFVADTDKIARTTAYYFQPDGHVTIRKKDYITENAEVAEFTEDISRNWEPYPEFGKYDSLIRRER